MTSIASVVHALMRMQRAAYFVCAALLPTASVQAEHIHIVSYDVGGAVMERYRLVSQLRLENANVRIQGQCLSACTMFLGLSTTCVWPSAILGFHGPHRRTQNHALADSAAVEIMAAHYPEPIRGWFLREAQYLPGDQIARVSGAQLISLGIKNCELM